MEPTECTGHSHDHEHSENLFSLRPYIDFSKTVCLNEEVLQSGKMVLKLHEERLTNHPSLKSPEDDPELLLTIPFTEAVTVQSITIRAGTSEGSAEPRHVKFFVNREDIDFDDARELEPAQRLELLRAEHFENGTVDYPTRPVAKFKNISCLTIYVEDNYGEDAATEIAYIGLKGKGSRMQRRAVETVYESQGMPKDHKVRGEFGAPSIL